jgi:uncharacterized integral membrane protein
MQAIDSNMTPEVYQGQFGTFTITDRDRQGVVIYRGALMVAAISFGMGTMAALLSQSGWFAGSESLVLNLITGLFTIFSVALGVALATIHIYMVILHRTLQAFLAIGSLSAFVFSIQYHQPLGSIVYYQPLTILGVGFTFAALTGIFFKEAFCFNRFETKILTFLVPMLLLGHLINILPSAVEALMLASWAGLFLVFAIRKVIQSIPPDIGDKSVFEYLESQK